MRWPISGSGTGLVLGEAVGELADAGLLVGHGGEGHVDEDLVLDVDHGEGAKIGAAVTP